jgi:hypothetical protein
MDEALAALRMAKAEATVAPSGNRRAITAIVAVFVAAAMLGVAWLGGVAGAWLLFFIGVFGFPLAAVAWLVIAFWGAWRSPLSVDLPDETDAGHSAVEDNA